MRNKNVYLDTIRWMLLPILFNVVCEVLKISVMFITAYYLGSVTDAALSGNYNLFFKVGKNLLIFMGISVVCIPILSIIMDFIWIKAGTISDIEMCSKISFWKYDKLKKFEEGEIEYKLSQELCEFRIYFANIFSNILLIPFFVAFLFYCINQLGAIYTVLGICCSLLTLLIPIIFRKVNFKYERENWQYNSEQNQILIQISEYAKAIKNFGLCDFFVERWKKLFTQYFVESRKKAIKIKNFVDEMNGFVKGVAQIAILLLGCILVDKKYITTGCIIMMLRYLSIYEIFFSRCIQMITDSYNIREKAQRLSVFYDDLEKQDGLKLSPVLDCIQCNRLTYCCGEKKVLKDISFEIRKGEKIQIVGKNGSGKSTLIKILCGFETEYEGEILINGTNMKELNLATWREKLAVVFQNDYIFSGTILENVLMGDLNAEKEDVEKIIHDVDILNMAEKKITYGSHELSGGEKQKIAIARAILKNSEVLIVDEGANHLDSDMRNFLHEYMKKTEQTVIFVSHDADFNDLAERILYL